MLKRLNHQFTYYVLCSAAAIMAASLFLTLESLMEEQRISRREFREDVLWHASRTESEAYDLLQSVARFGYGDPSLGLDEVLFNFDIFRSRVEVISSGDIGARYRELQGGDAAIEFAAEALVELEPQLVSLRRHDHEVMAKIMPVLEQTISAIHKPLTAVHHETQVARERHRARMEDISMEALVLLSGGLLSGFLLVFMSLMKQRCMNALSTTLETRARERTAELSEKVSDHQRAERALNDQYSLLQTLIQAIPAPVFYKNERGVFLGCNEPFENLIGTQHLPIVGKTVFDLMDEGRAVDYHRADAELLRSGGSQVYETRVEFSDGDWRDVMFNKAAFRRGDGSVGGLIGVMLDITERKRVERELERERSLLAQRVEERTQELRSANEELARAAKSKDEFLAGMSHELRTPLNAILGLSEALQEQVFGPLTGKQIEVVQTVEQSGRHLLSLINDILDIARIGSGEFKLQLDDVELEEVCQSSVTLIRPCAEKKQLELRLQIDETLGYVRADPRRLKQILVNLLSNAVKFTPAGGEVSLEVSGDAEAEALIFCVGDTGIGIAAEDLPRLFQPFIQLDSSLARQFEGTGLGLSLVYNMAQMHGGSVSVESEAGGGSRFTVVLPWHPVDFEEPRPVSADEAPGAPGEIERVLVIDDSIPVLDQLSRYLIEAGVSVNVSLQGGVAVQLAEQCQPDTIFLDLELPDMSGWQVLEQLKANPATRGIPVIILSVSDERERGLVAGACDYLIKPLDREVLWRTLRGLPVAVQAAPPPAAARSVTDYGNEGPVLLLVEDNEANIDSIGQYLDARGYRLVVARDGCEAIQRARQLAPALILMDIQMPGMDGLEATRILRSDSCFDDVPIVALTALAMASDRERCLAAGADDYMSKPVRLRELTAKIERYLQRGRCWPSDAYATHGG